MRNDADVKRGPKLVKTKPTSRVCGFQLISGGMLWRRWCSGIMQDSHSCDPGSIPGRRKIFVFSVTGFDLQQQVAQCPCGLMDKASVS